jgi:biotin carboxylase
MSTLLMIGPTLYLRELGIRSLVRSGHRLIFADSTSYHPFMQLADETIVCDLMDRRSAVEQIVRELRERSLRVDAVLTFGEWYVELTADLALRLGLRGVRPDVASICRDKWLMKERLRQRNVPVGAGRIVTGLPAAEQACAELGFPVVVKPRNYGGSDGVSRVEDAAQLRDTVGRLQALFAEPRPLFSAPMFERSSFVVERYIPGRELSVETLSTDHDHHIVQITEKLLGPEPDFFELGHIAPAALTAREHRQVTDYCLAILGALEVTNTISHIELRLAPEPSFIEIGARPGGDRIIDLAWFSRGIDLYAQLTAVLLGAPPVLAAKHDRVAMVQFLFTECTGAEQLPSDTAVQHELARTPGIAAYAYRNLVMASTAHPKRGDNRCGFALVVGATRAEVVSRIDGLRRRLAGFPLGV